MHNLAARGTITVQRQIFGLETSSTNDAVITAFGEATRCIAAHLPQAGAAIAKTLALDPQNVAAHALRGFASLILARSELHADAVVALSAAKHALRTHAGGTADERIFVDALSAAVAGNLQSAADILQSGFAQRSAPLLPFKIAHSLYFMQGDQDGMLRATQLMMRSWTADSEGAGFLLGCHAFALEEAGHYDEAEKIGRRAVTLQPDDAWALHAVSHVYEMRGATSSGISWLEKNRSSWSRCNNFSFHIAWHLALFHLEAGDDDKALALFDHEVRPVQTDDFRDMANAISLLRRLEDLGVNVGARWQQLAEIARRRRQDLTLVFASLHNLIALVATRDDYSVSVLLKQMESKSQGSDDQSQIARDVGLPLAHLIAGRGADLAKIERLARALPRLGGSNAQRDVFMLELCKASQVDSAALSKIRACRSEMKIEDRLMASVEQRALSGRSFSMSSCAEAEINA